MNPIKYTDRLLSVYQSACGTEATIHLLVNGVEIHADSTLFITGTYWAFQIDFGLMKPGDIFKVTDDCGSVPFQQTVKDDYVYVEVPSGPAVSGNGIGPNDQYPPYSKLSTPVSIGKCTPVTIDSHGLVNYNFFCPNTSGVFLVNGSPLTNQPSAINPGGYDINFNGFPGTPVYTINPNGSVTTNTNVKLESNTHYSGQIPIVLEYYHDGGVITGTELAFGFKAMSFRHLGGTGGLLEKAALGGAIDTASYAGSALSKYKITYDGVYYRAYIDNILIDELHRFVEYKASSGLLTPGSSAGLDYSTPVTWTGMNSGSQWVSILIDGVLYTRQLFNVAGDLAVNGLPLDIACNGGSSGAITVNATGGLPPLQYALNSGAYQSSNIFTGLAAGSYTVRVRDASGCTGTNVAVVGSISAVSASIAAKTDVSCSGASTGSITVLATGGSGTYTYSKDGSSFGASNVFSGLSAGPYIFYAKDGNGCTTSIKDTIRTTSNIIASIVSQQNVSCSGGNNGGFSVSTAGSLFNGTSQYSRDNGATFQASATFSGLAAGTYQVVVKDNSCSISLTISVTQPGALDVITTVTKAVSCSGVSDGVITATGSSGVAPYQFSINGTQYSGAAAFTGLAAGNYKIWAKDANGCVKESAIVSVTQPTVVSVSIFNKNDVACYGGNTGSLTLSGSGGTSPYSFSKDGTIFQPSPTFNSLSSGLLPITLKDANGCTATVSGEILQPADISVSASVSSPVSCFGGNNGSIQVTGSGGTGLIKYAIDGNTFTTALTFTGLSAISYVITAKDNNGCTKLSAPVVMSQASQIAPTASKTDVKCFAGQDGAVTITATGGTGAYNYSRDAVDYQTTGVFPGLISGAYTFSVKDANSCVRTVDVTVGQPTDLIANSSIQQQVLCYNGNSGIIQASSSGGIMPYQYSLNGNTYQNSSTFNALVIGSYKVWVKDANGCIKETISNTLTQPTELVGSVASQVAVKCYNGSDGAVLLASSGGTSPYLYSKDATNFQDTPSFTGLSASTINFLVKDANGCSKQITAQVTQPAQSYTITLANATNLTCYQENIGRIEIANSGGTAPYQVSLNNSQFQGSNVFSNLSSGTYTIYGKDANNCVFALQGVSLSQPTDIHVSLLMKKDVDCEYYTKGEALVQANGSNGNFTYTLSGSDFKFNPISQQTNSSGLFQNLSAGDYTVAARDQSGCTKNFFVTIIPKSTNIRYDVTKTLPSTCTSEDGSINVVNTSGGRPPYQYSISSQNSFTSSASFSNLLNGTYIVTVADELCSYKKEVDLKLPSSIVATYTIEPVSCETPVANLNVTNISGGSGNYSLSLNGSAFSPMRTFNNLHPNIYSLTIQDSPLTCKSVIGLEIKEQNRADLQVVSRQNVLCYGGNSGFINVTGDNNVGPFTYAINNGSYGQDGMFSNLSIGTYRLYAKNRLGCIDSIRVTLVQPTQLTGSFTKKDNDCYGDNTGNLEIFASGGTPDYKYSIDGTNYVSTGKFETLNANNYSTYIRDANGCINTQNIAIVQPTLLALTPMYQDTIRCFGESNGLVNIQANGGTPAYQYSINGADYLSDPKFGNLALGTYKFFVKDLKGCIKSSEITLTQPSILELALSAKTDPLCYEGKDGTIAVSSKGGNGGNIYTLDNNINQPQPLFQGLTQATYSLKVTDRKGCTASMETVSLKWPEDIQLKYTTVKPTCFGESNGSITVSVNGGTPGYYATFDGQRYDPVNAVFTFTKVRSNTWPIEIKDSHGCIEAIQVFVDQPTILDGNILISNNKCFDDQTGRIEVTGTGATPSYVYAIDNQSFTSNGAFGGLKANKYLIKVKDGQGCLLTREVTLTQPTIVQLSAINTDTVRCFGENNGSVKILASGGTPGYVYSSNGFDFFSDETFRNLKAGSYRFWVRDNHLCEHTANLTITEPPVLNLTLTEKRNPLCAGEQNGRIVLGASGGNDGYVFWKDNAVQQNNGIFEALTDAEYTFKAVDRKGCEDTVRSVRLTWPKPLASKTTWEQPTCSGDKDASVTVNLEGGVSPYSMTSPGLTPETSSNDAEWKYKGLEAGKYNFTSRDANGCVALASVTIQPAVKFNSVQFPVSEPVCVGQEVILRANNPGFGVQWFFNGQESASLKNNQEITAVNPGEYKMTVSNPTGCKETYTYTLVNNNNALKADFLMTIQAFVGDTVTVLDISKPTPDEIIWELPEQAQTVSNEITKLSFSMISKGTYPIKMTAKKGDCINTKIRSIEIFELEDIALTDSTLHFQDINLVQEMTVYPNPNFGKFTVTVKLAKANDAVLSISRSSTNAQVYRDEKKNNKEYVFEVDLKDFLQDVYIITIQAGKSILFKRALLMN